MEMSRLANIIPVMEQQNCDSGKFAVFVHDLFSGFTLQNDSEPYCKMIDNTHE